MRISYRKNVKRAFKERKYNKIKKYLKIHHPQFRGRNIYYVYTTPKKEWYAKTDRGDEPFIPQWAICSEPVKYCLYRIFRSYINPQMVILKSELPDPTAVELHHITPFNQLMMDFLLEKGISFDDFYIIWRWERKPYSSPMLPSIQSKKWDIKILLKEWYSYHEKHAVIVPVSKEEHIRMHTSQMKKNHSIFCL